MGLGMRDEVRWDHVGDRRDGRDGRDGTEWTDGRDGWGGGAPARGAHTEKVIGCCAEIALVLCAS